eukprot:CAMPEP_0194278586 /NCGR_PEP_ID=MMETSP0169-20130528/11732_1 /TAXON_ID=218684 /ORGANISM="Corethron pennatum, Strain L29A3" /LENGTH=66 /DNA_ID=CAMNT_0039022811 /DNA_START=82 /DNA_END=282 /DNA_ORIENTATION=+
MFVLKPDTAGDDGGGAKPTSVVGRTLNVIAGYRVSAEKDLALSHFTRMGVYFAAIRAAYAIMSKRQ